ncbi:MAG: adenylate/guanylate cyclase domain-containing protein [Microscillaceae bacterium]|nr:adenylate/guanylate cyclase domain-containing protein [Microscillaceae bacterium]
MNATILIIDDEEYHYGIAAEYLKNDNPEYRILPLAYHGKHALRTLAKEIPDIILLDWNMPVMNGIETLQKLKENPQLNNIPVIMITGETQAERLKEAFSLGVVDYIEKPYNELELLARVKSALALRKAQKETEELLLNILPKDVAEELKTHQEVIPQSYEQVSVLFTDFKGFSSITQEMSPLEMIQKLAEVFLMIEEIARKHHIEKIKTIGDAFMGAGGIPIPNKTNALDAVLAGWEIQQSIEDYRLAKEAKGEACFTCRLGIHTGSVVAGVIGHTKFAYDIWGKTVNVAARMESEGEPGKVNISGETYRLVKDFFDCEFRGRRPIKNMGEVDMYFVKNIKKELSVMGRGIEPHESFWLMREKISH